MNISASIQRLASLFFLFFIVLSGSLVYWQAIVAEPLVNHIHNGRHCLLENSPRRGNIYDRNGVLLATSKADPRAHCGYLRVYTEPSLAGLIGYYAGPDYSSTGIEKKYAALLNGETGFPTLDTLFNQALHRPARGSDIYLTIDLRIQRIVSRRLANPYNIDGQSTFPSKRGAAIVTNPRTGEVLAMVSHPNYDPNRLVQTLQSGDLSYYHRLERDRDQPLLFRPLWGRYIPGSTYKTVTLLAALDSAKTSLARPWSRQQALGPVYFNNHAIGPEGNNIDYYTKYYPVNTEYAYTHSDNVIFAQIGVNTGKDIWLEYNRRFYIGRTIPFDLPSAVSTVLPPGRALRAVDLAASAFGQGTSEVTPFQMSLFDNAIAAEGRLMRPRLLSKIIDHTQNTIQIYQPQQLSTPIRAETARQVRQAMYGVIQCGPGLMAHVNMNTSPWSIIGKTGTAQVSDNNNPPAHGWMITQAPYTPGDPDRLPALTIVAMRENSGEGGPSVGPMIAEMYNDIFSQNYLPVQRPPAPDWNYCTRTRLLQ
jgi:peptidoglycan glycosyltransferase